MPEADRFFDPLRRRSVAATPEERVRQWFIGVLSAQAGVPLHMMMSEVPMKYGLKNWRADIVVWASDGSALAVTECKRPGVALDADVQRQALRYQGVLGVRYIFLTNGGDTRAFVRSGSAFVPLDHIPSYLEMTA